MAQLLLSIFDVGLTFAQTLNQRNNVQASEKEIDHLKTVKTCASITRLSSRNVALVGTIVEQHCVQKIAEENQKLCASKNSLLGSRVKCVDGSIKIIENVCKYTGLGFISAICSIAALVVGFYNSGYALHTAFNTLKLQDEKLKHIKECIDMLEQHAKQLGTVSPLKQKFELEVCRLQERRQSLEIERASQEKQRNSSLLLAFGILLRGISSSAVELYDSGNALYTAYSALHDQDMHLKCIRERTFLLERYVKQLQGTSPQEMTIMRIFKLETLRLRDKSRTLEMERAKLVQQWNSSTILIFGALAKTLTSILIIWGSGGWAILVLPAISNGLSVAEMRYKSSSSRQIAEQEAALRMQEKISAEARLSDPELCIPRISKKGRPLNETEDFYLKNVLLNFTSFKTSKLVELLPYMSLASNEIVEALIMADHTIAVVGKGSIKPNKIPYFEEARKAKKVYKFVKSSAALIRPLA